MKTKTTGYHRWGSSAHRCIPIAMTAIGSEAEILRWTSKWSSKGWSVTVNLPIGERQEWQASANRRGEL